MTTRPLDFLQWAVETFGPIALDHKERARRFLEEAIELAHAEGLTMDTIDLITCRVFARDPGDIPREIGQCQATLECYALSVGVDNQAEADKEFERVKAIPKEVFAARHKAKVDLGIAAE